MVKEKNKNNQPIKNWLKFFEQQFEFVLMTILGDDFDSGAKNLQLYHQSTYSDKDAGKKFTPSFSSEQTFLPVY